MWNKLKAWFWPFVVGLAGWFAVVLTRTGPGVTSDEPFNVFYGKAFVTRFSEQGRQFFTQDSIAQTFASRSEHPPLGRWLIGWVHRIQDTRPRDSNSIDIYAARVSPATAFALILALLAQVVGSRHGAVAGIAAAVSLAIMPRVFGHAHLAALDTFVSCTYVVAVLAAAWMMERPWPSLHAPLAGILFGAALLTKIHGVLLMPVVGFWAVAYFRMRSVLPLFLWWLSGVEVFVLGWPWLWHDASAVWTAVWTAICDWTFPVVQLPRVTERLTAYLGSSFDRPTIYVTYLGRDWADWGVPWHYPWVMFAVTVPVGLHVLGLFGLGAQLRRVGRDLWRGGRYSAGLVLPQFRAIAPTDYATQPPDSRGGLYLTALLFPMCVFSAPGVPVYDGVRLFLMVFPFWAIFVGQGAGIVYEWLAARLRAHWACVTLGAYFACQAWGVVHYYPFHLSYYNALVRGLSGANERGFEVTYWGDAVTPGLVNRWSDAAPAKSCAVLVPTLYNEQQEMYETGLMKKREQSLRGSLASGCPYLIVYNRKAYLHEVEEMIDSPYFTPIAENSLDGVWLSRAYVRAPPQRSAGSAESLETGGR